MVVMTVIVSLLIGMVIFSQAEMVRKVKCYLHNMPVITNEDELTNLSYQCEPPGETYMLV